MLVERIAFAIRERQAELISFILTHLYPYPKAFSYAAFLKRLKSTHIIMELPFVLLTF